MDQFAFSPWIDLTLVGVTLAAFIGHFNRWAYRQDIETSVDLPSRLSAAQVRVVLQFAGILMLCWMGNLAVWTVYAILVAMGLVIAVVGGRHTDGGALGAAAYLIREWAFGFAQLILHPASHDATSSAERNVSESLVGRTGFTTTPLRPTGNAEIGGTNHPVASDDGGWLDAGVAVQVMAYRNGIACVAPVLGGDRSRSDQGEDPGARATRSPMSPLDAEDAGGTPAYP